MNLRYSEITNKQLHPQRTYSRTLIQEVYKISLIFSEPWQSGGTIPCRLARLPICQGPVYANTIFLTSSLSHFKVYKKPFLDYSIIIRYRTVKDCQNYHCLPYYWSGNTSNEICNKPLANKIHFTLLKMMLNSNLGLRTQHDCQHR